jgi:hypothetical protein
MRRIGGVGGLLWMIHITITISLAPGSMRRWSSSSQEQHPEVSVGLYGSCSFGRVPQMLVIWYRQLGLASGRMEHVAETHHRVLRVLAVFHQTARQFVSPAVPKHAWRENGV